MRLDRLSPAELDARAADLMSAALDAAGIDPADVSPARIERTARLLCDDGPRVARREAS